MRHCPVGRLSCHTLCSIHTAHVGKFPPLPFPPPPRVLCICATYINLHEHPRPIHTVIWPRKVGQAMSTRVGIMYSTRVIERLPAQWTTKLLETLLHVVWARKLLLPYDMAVGSKRHPSIHRNLVAGWGREVREGNISIL